MGNVLKAKKADKHRKEDRVKIKVGKKLKFIRKTLCAEKNGEKKLKGNQ